MKHREKSAAWCRSDSGTPPARPASAASVRTMRAKSSATFIYGIRTRERSHGAALLLLALTLSSAGCANVAAYERGKLAHPTMSPSDTSSVAREHVYAIQEGAMGGSVGAA